MQSPPTLSLLSSTRSTSHHVISYVTFVMAAASLLTPAVSGMGGLYYTERGGRPGWTANWDTKKTEANDQFDMPGKCLPIPAEIDMCLNVGYSRMAVPNLLQHNSMGEIAQQINSFKPLVNSNCHKFTSNFLCSLFAPMCTGQDTPLVPPCMELCESVKDSCLPMMKENGFNWPAMLSCTLFPRHTVDPMCILPTSLQNSTTNHGSPSIVGVDTTSSGPAIPGHGTAKKIKVCPQCRKFKQEIIKKKYCRAQFAIKVELRRVFTRKNSLKLALFSKRRQVLRRKRIQPSLLSKVKSLVLVTKRKSRKRKQSSGKATASSAKCSCAMFKNDVKLPTKKRNRLTYVAMGYRRGKRLIVTALVQAGKVEGGAQNLKYIRELRKNKKIECKGISVKKTHKKKSKKNKNRRKNATTKTPDK